MISFLLDYFMIKTLFLHYRKSAGITEVKSANAKAPAIQQTRRPRQKNASSLSPHFRPNKYLKFFQNIKLRRDTSTLLFSLSFSSLG